jgi:hypothetical protein
MDWLPERLKEMREAALAGATRPLVGVTTDGEPVPGLFSIERTGVSTETIKDAAAAFLASSSRAT